MEAVVSRPWRFVWVAFITGLIGLGQEIAWVRIFSFMTKSVPQAFSFVLFFYVVGIAIGARFSRKLIEAESPDRQIAWLLVVSGALICFAPALLSSVAGSSFAIGWTALLIFLPASLKGAIFPIVHHYFSSLGKRLGATLSLVYFCNVLGSALGPLLVGFVLLDIFSAYVVLYLLGVLELLVAIVFLYKISRFRGAISAAILSLLIAVSYFPAEKAMVKAIGAEYYEGKLTNVIENRYGVIHTIFRADLSADRVYGGNVYDGAINADITHNVNGIERVYLLSVLQQRAERVAVIGLSSASWLKVIQAFPSAKSIDVIEINPGYVELAKRYDGFSDYLHDPRVHLHFIDGRKWLAEEVKQGNRFDLIVMNNTWHWRSHSTNLLSKEFMQIVEKSLSDDGLATFNTTGSMDVFYTASRGFQHAWLYRNFVYVAKRDLRADLSIGLERFCALRFSQIGLVGCEDAKVLAAAHNMLSVPMQTWAEYSKVALDRPPELITDNNMLSEYRYGRSVFD